MQQGWECPKCGKVHAPWVAECDCHKRAAVEGPGWTWIPSITAPTEYICPNCGQRFKWGVPHTCCVTSTVTSGDVDMDRLNAILDGRIAEEKTDKKRGRG